MMNYLLLIDIETLKKAGVNTLVGMITVFIILILIIFIIDCFKFIPLLERKFKKTEEIVTEEIVEYETEEVDDLETVAVITAALMAYISDTKEEYSTDGLVVRNIRRRVYK